MIKHQPEINFGDNPNCKRVLIAYSFPENSEIKYWNNCSLEELKQESKEYSTDKEREIKRFEKLTKNSFLLLNQPLSLEAYINIVPNTKYK